MDALRAGFIVKFDSVAAELGHIVKGEAPGYVISKDAAKKIFEDGMKGLLESGHFRHLYGYPFLAIFPPNGGVRQELTIPFAINLPNGGFPWQ